MQSSMHVNPAEIAQALTLSDCFLGMTPSQCLIHTTQVYISFQQHAKHAQQLIGVFDAWESCHSCLTCIIGASCKAFQSICLAFKHMPHLLSMLPPSKPRLNKKQQLHPPPPSSTCSALPEKKNIICCISLLQQRMASLVQ